MLHKKILLGLGLAALLCATNILTGSAQQSGPQFLITWSAASYAPPGFSGKILPTANSPIVASFEVINQGKLVNLAGKTIYWYVNDALIENASGKQTAVFLAPAYAPNTITLRIQLPDYGGFIFQEIKIPVVSPKVVIESRYRQGNFSGASASVRGLPYFFNVKNLSFLNFSWTVNGETAPNVENPGDLAVSLNPAAPSGSTVNIGLTIKDPRSFLAQASNMVSLNYVK